MPASSTEGKVKGKGKYTRAGSKEQGKGKTGWNTWHAGQQKQAAGETDTQQQVSSSPAKAKELEDKSKDLKAKLMSSAIHKSAKKDIICLDGDEADTPAQSSRPSNPLPPQTSKVEGKVGSPVEPTSGSGSSAPTTAAGAATRPPPSVNSSAASPRAPPERAPAPKASDTMNHDQKLAARSERFGDKNAATIGKSSMATKRPAAMPALESQCGVSSAGSLASASVASESVALPAPAPVLTSPAPPRASSQQSASPAASVPSSPSASSTLNLQAVEFVPGSAAHVAAPRSSDGARTKAGSSALVTPRGTAGAAPALGVARPPAAAAQASSPPAASVASQAVTEPAGSSPLKPAQVAVTPAGSVSSKPAQAATPVAGSDSSKAEHGPVQGNLLGSPTSLVQGASSTALPSPTLSGAAQSASATVQPATQPVHEPSAPANTVPRQSTPGQRAERPAPAVLQTASAGSVAATGQVVAAPVLQKPASKAVPAAHGPTQQERACLKRALEAFSEPPRKKVRLVEDAVLWEAEYKHLLAWLDENLSDYMVYSKPQGPGVKCTDEKLAELQKLVSGVEVR